MSPAPELLFPDLNHSTLFPSLMLLVMDLTFQTHLSPVTTAITFKSKLNDVTHLRRTFP